MTTTTITTSQVPPPPHLPTTACSAIQPQQQFPQQPVTPYQNANQRK